MLTYGTAAIVCHCCTGVGLEVFGGLPFLKKICYISQTISTFQPVSTFEIRFCLNRIYSWTEPPSCPMASLAQGSLPGEARVPHLYVCFGFVEQAQGGVAVTVRSQRDEGLQPLQTQPQVSPPVGNHREQREMERET